MVRWLFWYENPKEDQDPLSKSSTNVYFKKKLSLFQQSLNFFFSSEWDVSAEAGEREVTAAGLVQTVPRRQLITSFPQLTRLIQEIV